MTQFTFDLGDEVDIIDIDQKALVTGRAQYIDGENEFRVVYWYDGIRKLVWANARELKKRKS